MAVKPIPEGYHSVTPCLSVNNPREFIAFVKAAFGAEERSCYEAPDGTVMHAEVKIGDSIIMLGQSSAQFPAQPASFSLYVPDTDAAYRRAIEAGGKTLREPADQFYGDRSAGVADHAGISWWISTHVEDVSREEMERRMKAREKAA